MKTKKTSKQKIKIKIQNQGAVLVNTNSAVALSKNKDLVAVIVDFKSKYCEVDAYSSGDKDVCAVLVGANKQSINLHKSKDMEESTKIIFVEYPEKKWKIFSANVSRYTLYICFIKNNI